LDREKFAVTEPYRDPAAPVTARIEDLLSRMTLGEKLAQLGCLWITDLVSGGRFDADVAAGKMPNGIGQVTRIGASTGLTPEGSAALMNAIQRVAMERTRLGIPMFVHEEAVGGLCARDATVFPQALGLAATWNPELVEAIGVAIRRQMLAVGARLALSPVLDVARDPRWGRVEETYGESPVLCAALGTAYVRGVQGDDLAHGVAATGKHFLGYAMSEGGRNWGPVQVGPRELREVYAEPFGAAIRDANLACIMNSYSSVDGLPCAGSRSILTGLLRDELGFDGAVVADYGAVLLLQTHHHTAGSPGEAAAQALTAGLDMELPALECYGEPLEKEIETGRVPLSAVDTAVRRVLSLKFALGLFERPYVDENAAGAAFDTPEDRALARSAAAQSVILLSNDGSLPIRNESGTIAVIGPGADDPRLLQGDYHYPAHLEIIYGHHAEALGEYDPGTAPEKGGAFAPGPYYTPHVTPLAGLREALGESRVTFAPGCDLFTEDRSGFGEAVRAAKDADLAVVVVAGKSGLARPATSGEANDATDLSLPGLQEELVETISATGTPTVVVVLSGRVHSLERVARNANALVMLVPAGEEGGHGLADVLTGAVAPSGRLPVSLPRATGQIPVFAETRSGGDRAMFFKDYIDSPATPLFALGHGLGYSRIFYDNVHAEAGTTRDMVTVEVDVIHAGARDAVEVVQLYYRDEVASVARPVIQLAGFARLSLQPGQTRHVTFTVHPTRLAFYDAEMRFVVEPGDFTFKVGRSSADTPLEITVNLTGEIAEYAQRAVIPTAAQVE
jgi:beta-glucosidase